MPTASRYLARQRRRRNDGIVSGYGLTESYALGKDIPSQAAGGFQAAQRADKVTIDFKLKTRSGANGIVFEVGGATGGTAFYVDGEDFGFVTGGAGVLGVQLTGTLGHGSPWHVVCFSDPPNDLAKVYVDGDLVATGNASGGFSDWTNIQAGAVGAINTGVNSAVPLGQQVSLTGASLLTPVRFFVGYGQ